MARTKLPAPAAIRADADALYSLEVAETGERVYSPVAATKALAARYGVSTDRVASPVAATYYRRNGEGSPLDLSPDATDAAIRRAVRVRRDAPGLADGSGFSTDGRASLGRWETVAASASASLGRRFSPADARRFYGFVAPGDTGSYSGRGTFAGAPSLRDGDGA